MVPELLRSSSTISTVLETPKTFEDGELESDPAGTSSFDDAEGCRAAPVEAEAFDSFKRFSLRRFDSSIRGLEHKKEANYRKYYLV